MKELDPFDMFNFTEYMNPFYSKTRVYPPPKRKGLSCKEWSKRKKARKTAKRARKRKK